MRPLLLSTLVGCSSAAGGACITEAPEAQPCAGLQPSETDQETPLVLRYVGATLFEDATDLPFGARLFETQEDWDLRAAQHLETVPAPDFTTEVVIEHVWNDGGCGATTVPYTAWRIDDALRVRLSPIRTGACFTCDALNPMVDYIVLQRGSATDIAWCE